MRSLTQVFKALSDETRLQMLGLLFKERELCVCDFSQVLQITQSKASRHLRHLVAAGLLDDRREAVWVYFRIADKPKARMSTVLAMLPAVLDAHMPPQLFARLAAWQQSKRSQGGACTVRHQKDGTHTASDNG